MDFEGLLQGLGSQGLGSQAIAQWQERLRSASELRASEFIEGSSGGGAVRIRLSGGLTVQSIAVAPAAAAAIAADPALIEDLLTTALGDALRRWRDRYGATPEEQIQKLMS